MTKKIIGVTLLAATLFSPATYAVSSFMETTTEATTSQVYDFVEMNGQKKSGHMVLKKSHVKARIYVNLDNYEITVTYNDVTYTATALGDNMYGFKAQDGYYYTFSYVIR